MERKHQSEQIQWHHTTQTYSSCKIRQRYRANQAVTLTSDFRGIRSECIVDNGCDNERLRYIQSNYHETWNCNFGKLGFPSPEGGNG